AADVGSVRLSYDGASRIENVEPYALFGDDTKGDLWGGTRFDPGLHEVTIDVFAGAKGRGPLLESFSFEFEVI
ncbi:MAG: hypothetical protein AAGF90_16090, partial [Pseudomonadota bacterium]